MDRTATRYSGQVRHGTGYQGAPGVGHEHSLFLRITGLMRSYDEKVAFPVAHVIDHCVLAARSIAERGGQQSQVASAHVAVHRRALSPVPQHGCEVYVAIAVEIDRSDLVDRGEAVRLLRQK